jgi:microcystin degradation protein MlrC
MKKVELELGGKMDPVHGVPLKVKGRIIKLVTVNWHAQSVSNKHAVVQVDGVKIIVTERRTPFHYIKQFEELDIDVHKVNVCGVGITEIFL